MFGSASEWLQTGLGYGTPRQDTMRSLPPRMQNAPAMTASRMPVTPRGNVAITGGTNVNAFGSDGLIYGRLSLGFVASLIVVVSVAYMWTRNVQGGG